MSVKTERGQGFGSYQKTFCREVAYKQLWVQIF